MSGAHIELECYGRPAYATILRVTGNLDAGSIPDLNKVSEKILAGFPPFVVVEMSGLRLLSSSALGSLMGLRKRLVDKDGDMALAGPNLDIKTKLNLLGALRIFKAYGDIRGAMSAYRWEHTHASQKLSLEFPSELRFVPSVRQLVSRVARQKGFGSRDSFRVETIVDEICNNAVEHSLKGGDTKIELYLRIARDRIEIQVVGKSDPKKAQTLQELSQLVRKSPPANIEYKRGRGLALIKMLSNNLKIDFSEKGTSVLVTRLRGE